MSRTLNLGILAHVDAGKTTLTERLLHAAGVIDRVGRVDDGTTRTDTLALERERGITIKSAVVCFPLGDLTVNLIDTPGHPDFIAEVERVLDVLDGAVLVVSAVEGVQPQTRVLMRVLRRLAIPTLLFVNKVDRSGAGYDAVLREIAEKLGTTAVPMTTVTGLGTRTAAVAPYVATDPVFVDLLVNALAEASEDFLGAYLADEGAFTRERLVGELAEQVARAAVCPVFFGAAATGAGVDALSAGIRDLLPAGRGSGDGALSGTVFKVERGAAGEKVAYVRMHSGTLHVRDRLPTRNGGRQKVTAISVFGPGADVAQQAVQGGRIAKVWGLHDVRIGDAVGQPRRPRADRHFSPPTLEAVVVPVGPADAASLYPALVQLAEQDPLIDVRRDETTHETTVSLYGEVQKEVIQATLARDFGVAATFRETTTICIERLVGAGEAVEVIGTSSNPYLATVGLRVEPAPAGAGVTIRLGVELGSMPPAFFKAVEDGVRETVRHGVHGWEVTDCAVTITHSGYWARQSHAHGTFDKSMSSTAGDFRDLTPVVLRRALRLAGTTVLEPVHRFRVEAPADTLAALLAALPPLRAVPRAAIVHGGSCVVEGEVPAATVHALEQRLPGLTGGEGVLETALDHHQPVRGEVPTRSLPG